MSGRQKTTLSPENTGKINFESESTGKRKSPLPIFDAKEQESKVPPAEMKVLQRVVGTWQDEGVVKVAEGKNVDTRMTTTKEVTSILGGHFVRQEACDNDGKIVFVSIQTFDPQQQAYRQWLFHWEGFVTESSGQWDETTDTLTLTDEGQGITGVSTIHFLDDETAEWSVVYKDQQGKDYDNIEGKSIRQK